MIPLTAVLVERKLQKWQLTQNLVRELPALAGRNT
jgi:hypothetical protein